MTFINLNNEELEYNGDLTLTKQGISLFDFKIKGDYSVNFKVSNNAKNRKLLNYHGGNQVTLSENSFTLVDEYGNIFTYGTIRVNKESQDNLECFFVSGNTGWFDTFDFNLNEMEYNNYYCLYSDFNARKAATGGIIFPMINTHGDVHKSEYFYPIPFIYLHSILSEITFYTRIKFIGTLFGSAVFKNTIISPTGGLVQNYKEREIVDYRAKVTKTALQAVATLIVYVKIVFDSLLSAGGKATFDTTNSRYTVNKKGTYKVTVRLVTSVSQDYSIFIYKNGVVTLTEILLQNSNVGGYTDWTGYGYINADIGDYLELWIRQETVGPVVYNILSDTYIQVELADKLEMFQEYTFGQYNIPYVVPSTVVPSIKARDLIKFVALYYGCSIYYDDQTKTISLNQIDLITDQEDWSDFYISHEVDYNTGIAKNNYIQFAKSNEYKAYNEQNDVTWGGAKIEVPIRKQDDKTLYTVPFSPVYENFEPNRVVQGAFIDYLGLKETDQNIQFTGVTNSFGKARFACANSFQEGDYIKIKSQVYNGVARVGVVTSTYFETASIAYSANESGEVIKMSESKNDGGENRICLVAPGINASDCGSVGTVYFGDPTEFVSYSAVSSTTAPFAYFDKPLYGDTVDGIKVSLSIDSVNGNFSLKDTLYKKMQNMIASPRIRTKMYLPLNTFKNFQFDTQIYLKTETLVGLFFVEAINNYKNSSTPVEVTLYKV